MEFKKYKRSNVAEMHTYKPQDMYPKEVWDRLSISATDKENGSPKEGDMFARNPLDHNDMWLVAKKYFEENFEEVEKESPLDMVSVAGKVVSYCEMPPELTSKHWISDYPSDAYVQVHIEQEDQEMDEVSKWIVEKYPELKDEEFFFIHVDY